MSKIRLFKGKLENKEIQNAISKKGLRVATSGLLMASIASGIMLSSSPQEANANTTGFNRVYNGGAFVVNGVLSGDAEVEVTTPPVAGVVKEVGGTVKDTVEILRPSTRPTFLPTGATAVVEETEESVTSTAVSDEEYFAQVESKIQERLGARYIHNPKLSVSQYRKSIEFDLNKGLDKAVTTMANLLNYHGSKEFDLTVTKTDRALNSMTIVVGFSPDLSQRDVNGYATKLNINEYSDKDLESLVSRYNNVLGLIGYTMVDYEDTHTRIDNLQFRMNYDNGRMQYEYDYIMKVIDGYIKEQNGDVQTLKDKKFSLKLTSNSKTKRISVTIFEAN